MKFVVVSLFALMSVMLSPTLSTFAQAQAVTLPAHDYFKAAIKDGVTTLTLKEEGLGQLHAFAHKMTAAGFNEVGIAENNLIISCKQRTTSTQYAVTTECKFQYLANSTGPDQYIGSSRSSRIITATQNIVGLEVLGTLRMNLSNSIGQQVVVDIGKSRTLVSLQYVAGLR